MEIFRKRLVNCGMVIIMFMLMVMVIKHDTLHNQIQEGEIPLASCTNAQFFINNSSYQSDNVSYLLCNKVGTGTISYTGKYIYNEQGIDEYIENAPDVCSYVNANQSVRWVKIYKSFYGYYVIGEIYDNPQSDKVTSMPVDSKSFAHTVGTDIYINDEKILMQGVVASNDVACSPTVYDIDMMSEADYKEIKSLGFNTVRFLLNYNILEDDTNPYVYKQSGWDWIDMNLEWAQKHGIRLILDCHLSTGGVTSRGFNQNVWTAGEPNQERLVSMWRAIAERYKNNTNVLGYGILNEPIIDNGDRNAWTQLSNRLITTIREVDKNHMLFIQRAQMSETGEYIYPEVQDNNWVLEVHNYPGSKMKFLDRYFVIPDSYLYYGNDMVVGYRNEQSSVETNVTIKEIKGEGCITNEWMDYSFDFVAGDSNNAMLFFEVLNLAENQSVEMKDITVTSDGIELYNLKYNTEDNYYLWSKDNAETVMYDAKNNYISISGPVSYLSLQDTGFYRYFRVEPGKKYKVSFKARSQTGISSIIKLKVSAKEYYSSKIYFLNKQYMEMLMDYTDIQAKYNVPIFYGEIGILGSSFNENRGMEQLSSDILNWLHDNSCHFTWFTWHEPTFGIYYISGVAPKDNPNEVLLKQIKEIFAKE